MSISSFLIDKLSFCSLHVWYYLILIEALFSLWSYQIIVPRSHILKLEKKHSGWERQ